MALPSGGCPSTQTAASTASVFVELSLNKQNFTNNKCEFTYHGAIDPEAVVLISHPEGAVLEPPPKEDTKATKGKKPDDAKRKAAAADEAAEVVVVPGSKIGVPVRNLPESDFSALRANLYMKSSAGDEEPQKLKPIFME